MPSLSVTCTSSQIAADASRRSAAIVGEHAEHDGDAGEPHAVLAGHGGLAARQHGAADVSRAPWGSVRPRRSARRCRASAGFRFGCTTSSGNENRAGPRSPARGETPAGEFLAPWDRHRRHLPRRRWRSAGCSGVLGASRSWLATHNRCPASFRRGVRTPHPSARRWGPACARWCC